jgi:hypothetical protein
VGLGDDYQAAGDRRRLEPTVGELGQIAGHRLVCRGQGNRAAALAIEKIAPAGGVRIDRRLRFRAARVVLDALGGVGNPRQGGDTVGGSRRRTVGVVIGVNRLSGAVLSAV